MKLNKFSFLVSLFLGVLASVLIVLIARDHNPQMEYTINPESLWYLGGSAFIIVFIVSIIMITLISFLLRKLNT